MFHIIYAESALELIPKEIASHSKIKLYAKRKGKPVNKILLDASKFHFAMKKLNAFNKRGRPDIVHFSLLYALGSDLNKSDKLRLHVHTLNDMVIEVNPEVRLPRNYNRFIGLIEKLYEEKEIINREGTTLLKLKRGTIKDLISEINPDLKILLKENAEKLTLEKLRGLYLENGEIAFIIGAFPHGNFSKSTKEAADLEFSVSDNVLDAWNATGKLICLCEQLDA